MTDLPKPNWYDDGNGQERWWDGRAWTQYTRPVTPDATVEAVTAVLEPRVPVAVDQIAAAPPNARSGGAALATVANGWADRARARFRPRRTKRTKPTKKFLVPVIVGLVAFVLGTGIGQAGHAAPAAVDPSTTPAFAKLEAALTTMTEQRDGLQQKVDEAEAQVSTIESRTSELDGREADLATTKKELDARSKKLDKREAKLVSASESSASTSAVSDSEPEPESVYYANCTAARAAGAAPVRVGDPGYSRKLDRDGDGVGCE